MNPSLETLTDSLIRQIRKENSQIGYDRTFQAALLGQSEKGCQICVNGHTYHIPNCTGRPLTVPALVWVTIPSGRMQDMYVSAIAGNGTMTASFEMEGGLS